MRRSFWRRLVVVLCAGVIGTSLIAGACASPAPAPPAAKAPAVTPASPSTKPAAGAGDATAGKSIFDANCTACHPGGGQGNGPSIIGAVGKLGEAGVSSAVRGGKGEMPAFSETTIGAKQLADLMAYLATLK
ncbi:MAG: cytochrome c [Chloroflexi bacterium]|nr:cytochrome c [Chloroflexota bacterium]